LTLLLLEELLLVLLVLLGRNTLLVGRIPIVLHGRVE